MKILGKVYIFEKFCANITSSCHPFGKWRHLLVSVKKWRVTSVDITEILEISRGREKRIGFPKLVPDLFRDILKARLSHELVDCFGEKLNWAETNAFYLRWGPVKTFKQVETEKFFENIFFFLFLFSICVIH